MKTSIYRQPLLIFIGILFVTMCGRDAGQTPPIPGNKTGKQIAVVITAGTALRIDPIIFSSRVEQLKKGEVIEILDRSAEEKTIGNQKSYWYKAKLASGITGWVFGSNINLLQDSNTDNMESYLSQFWEKETEELSTALVGKWWSVNRFGDYTNHCLEIYKDGKYKSYVKGATRKSEGSYNFDFNKSQIVFLGEKSFEGELTYVKRGDIYTLYRETSNDEIRFKKINMNPESETEDQASQKQGDATDAVKKDDAN